MCSPDYLERLKILSDATICVRMSYTSTIAVHGMVVPRGRVPVTRSRSRPCCAHAGRRVRLTNDTLTETCISHARVCSFINYTMSTFFYRLSLSTEIYIST